MKTTKEMIEVMLAHERGVPIQVRDRKFYDTWINTVGPIGPNWNWENYDYRPDPDYDGTRLITSGEIAALINSATSPVRSVDAYRDRAVHMPPAALSDGTLDEDLLSQPMDSVETIKERIHIDEHPDPHIKFDNLSTMIPISLMVGAWVVFKDSGVKYAVRSVDERYGGCISIGDGKTDVEPEFFYLLYCPLASEAIQTELKEYWENN